MDLQFHSDTRAIGFSPRQIPVLVPLTQGPQALGPLPVRQIPRQTAIHNAESGRVDGAGYGRRQRLAHIVGGALAHRHEPVGIPLETRNPA